MDRATAQSVLGDFDGEVFTSHGVTTTFSRRGDAFFVNTEGPDGELHDYEIAYAFGVEPLQQYLVEFPGGRMQPLSIAWDSRPVEQGGQRWFRLYPDERIEPTDPLHWTRPSQNWNSQCAECHSTNVRKNFDAASLSYTTSWSETDVSCEACHGPGSEHVDWAKLSNSERASRRDPYGASPDRQWIFDPGRPVARLASGAAPSGQFDKCAPCHSHRTALSDAPGHGIAFDESHRLSWIEEPLYFVDGHMREEVFVGGSFRQSKMYRAGVQCTDCHDPHTADLLARGDALCARCHSPAAFATPAHSHHATELGVECVDCHMPSRTYMVIDDRRDHSFSIPRPDVAHRLGTPDACAACHESEPPEELIAAFQDWYPYRAGTAHSADVFDRARLGDPSALGSLLTIVRDESSAPLVRGSAIMRLRYYPPDLIVDPLFSVAEDEEPLLRRAAMEVMAGFPLGMSKTALMHGLSDASRAVRLAAVQSLIDAGARFHSGTLSGPVTRALQEYRLAMGPSIDLPAGQLRLAALEQALGRNEAAESALRRARALDDLFTPASINLADHYRSTGREHAGRAILEDALTRSPTDASLHHAYGLALVRAGQRTRAMGHLEIAAREAPKMPRNVLAYAVALHSADRTDEAIELLRRGVEHNPFDRDLISTIVQYYRKIGDRAEAERFALRLQWPAPPSAEEATGN